MSRHAQPCAGSQARRLVRRMHTIPHQCGRLWSTPPASTMIISLSISISIHPCQSSCGRSICSTCRAHHESLDRGSLASNDGSGSTSRRGSLSVLTCTLATGEHLRGGCCHQRHTDTARGSREVKRALQWCVWTAKVQYVGGHAKPVPLVEWQHSCDECSISSAPVVPRKDAESFSNPLHATTVATTALQRRATSLDQRDGGAPASLYRPATVVLSGLGRLKAKQNGERKKKKQRKTKACLGSPSPRFPPPAKV
jgi:hypothetical protein